jgi:hypothetical protein
MSSQAPVSINTNPFADETLHEQIKFRAYNLYMKRRPIDCQDLKDTLQGELEYVAFAAAALQKYAEGEVGETMVVRAAQVYLRTLTSLDRWVR